ncbi:hypothetical protein A2955_01790 [Candidatus Woesebacteria bacterium RIFCSPLOWO2_01_FULL_37_19]|uniref:Uncharacterized protein n=1 Tax=Candidatus Woesebacteria bacterium RIFCSPLOWO2_01_FULL_37_19 TaxID=1802514 RepID=A0A1F8BBC8_9BACT|nr:MAG: hypothetical protein A2955_01790 [Candidatus Woesebacteria bacterium RIFCSPLOWO2_01_FULL_37_19]
MINNKMNRYLFLIFLAALIIRFLYYPSEISFGYDQARDAYASLKAVSGDFKIIGPPTTMPDVYHGSAFYYIFGPIYKLFGTDPEVLSMFLRIYNAFGIFLVYFIALNLFKDKKIALLSSIFFAFSFEQTQYAMFLGHPALGVISTLVFYLGLSLFIFNKKKIGLSVALFGAGMSMQFHFTLINLFFVFLITAIIFRKQFLKINLKVVLLSILALSLSVSTFILAEIKYGFRTTNTLLEFLGGKSMDTTKTIQLENLAVVLKRFLHDNVYSFQTSRYLILPMLLITFYWVIRNQKYKEGGVFLFVWLFAGILPYISGGNVQTNYYFAIGASVSILILSSVVIVKIYEKYKFIGGLIFSLIILSNLKLVTSINPKGTLPEVNAQVGMHLPDEKLILDYIYQKAEGKAFSVNALTIPYKINTTWSYLFEWYGLKRYGYLPIWGGDAAEGYEGNLEVIKAQSKLPKIRFSIVEPKRGMEAWMLEEFTKDEDLFWELKEEKKFGDFVVQYRNKRI